MEPVAWAAQSGMMLFWGWYYFLTKSGSDMTSVAKLLGNRTLRKKCQKEGFSIEHFNNLVYERKDLEKKYDKIKRSM